MHAAGTRAVAGVDVLGRFVGGSGGVVDHGVSILGGVFGGRGDGVAGGVRGFSGIVTGLLRAGGKGQSGSSSGEQGDTHGYILRLWELLLFRFGKDLSTP